jgi:hypothetical protein
MKTYAAALPIIAALCLGCGGSGGTADSAAPPAANDAITQAVSEHRSGTQITGEGVVTRILPDDRDGNRHQRFILRIGSGQTLLVAHNIDLAPRLSPLEVGDRVAFKGIYEWNPQGGLVHWTHHDPSGRHPAGWLRHHGATIQ